MTIFEQASRSGKAVAMIFLFCLATTIFTPAQTFTKLIDFNGGNGASPLYDSLVQGRDGNLYGTTSGGGAYGYGTVFKMTRSGALTTLYSFCAQAHCQDGEWPMGGLLLASDGELYGTTNAGGSTENDYPSGTIFRITKDGKLTTLYNFGFGDGAYPTGALIQGSDKNFYGTTSRGGDLAYDWACGTVFRMTPQGGLWKMAYFYCNENPTPIAGLVQATDGNFYGTTEAGLVFKITTWGALTSLYFFGGPDGGDPMSALIQASDGNLYGTTYAGGTSGSCSNGCGTVFKLARKIGLTQLHSFNGADGSYPHGPLLQATNGTFYGTTSTGGDNNLGTVFKMTTDGTVTTLYSFQGADGSNPVGGLVQASDGKLYGTTSGGGVYGGGTAFSLDLGLGPMVKLVRDSAPVGATGGILGQGFTGTTEVSVNGTPAVFTVVSDTYLTAQVPSGATTGFVTVATPGGKLTSNKPLRVTPQLLSFDPPSGPIGTQVTITGVSLTQTVQVGFGNRVPAPFTVNSDTQVIATVPAGAQTGKVGIETQGGTDISSAAFSVTQ